MNQPLVSILIPVYGVENYIAKCCKSLFSQTYKNIEFIFVNDCTKDESMIVLQKILNEYPDRYDQVRIINHVHNKGLAGARNTAVAAAMGKYIIHVDSDDFLIENTTIEILVEKCEEDNLDLCFFDCKKYYINDVIPFSENIPGSKDKFLKLMLSRFCSSSIWGKMIKTELYKKNNISCKEGINFGEDYCVMPLLLFYSENYSHISSNLYGYNLNNPNSYTYRFSIINTRQILIAIDYLLKEFQLRGADQEYLDCLKFAKLKAKGEAINQWLATGTSIVDFLELKSINVDKIAFHKLPFKYILYLIMANLFTANFCKQVYKIICRFK